MRKLVLLALFALVGCTDAPAAQDSPLLSAVLARDTAEVHRLAAVGTDLNGPDENGRTPLSWAVSRESGDVVALLLRLGADPAAADHAGVTPLHLAADTTTAAALLAHGAGLEARDAVGKTPLWVAAVDGHAEVAAFLVRRGANARTRDGTGASPLHWSRWPAAAAVLLNAGANVNGRDGAGATPLDVAESLSRREYAAFLQSRGGVRSDGE